jgi:hypothetical protein
VCYLRGNLGDRAADEIRPYRQSKAREVLGLAIPQSILQHADGVIERKSPHAGRHAGFSLVAVQNGMLYPTVM